MYSFLMHWQINMMLVRHTFRYVDVCKLPTVHHSLQRASVQWCWTSRWLCGHGGAVERACVWPDCPARSGKTVLIVEAFPRLRGLCLAINKSLWITGSQYSCVRVWAGQWNDCSSGGLSTHKNAVWWDCRLGERRGGGQVLIFQKADKKTHLKNPHGI